MKALESDNARFDLGERELAAGVHRFAHCAMATVFEVYCVHPDAKYAGQAAQAAFNMVDRLELDLSRFIENSDISRINSLESGQATRVSPWTLECLKASRQMYEATERAFDISMGTGLCALELDPGEMTVRATTAGVRLDLGGIGKGYAVDRMAEVMEEWEIPRSLLHGGFSSVLALEPPPDKDGWQLTLSRPGPDNKEVLARVCASQRAFSASGLQKGNHIFDPRGGQPVQDRLASWVSLPRGAVHPFEMATAARSSEAAAASATFAEALSTAFMILSNPEVAACCEKWPGLEAWLIMKSRKDEPELPALMHLSGP